MRREPTAARHPPGATSYRAADLPMLEASRPPARELAPRWHLLSVARGAVASYSFHVLILAFTAAVLYTDAHLATMSQQYLLGALTAGFLLAATRFSPPGERRQVWILVAIATAVEFSCSLGWGIYRYRFANVPVYVPPGHGLVYLFALRWARTPLMQRHGPLLQRATLLFAVSWAVLGALISPHLGGRADVLGCLLIVPFAWFLRKPSASIYTGVFIATTYLELLGTGFANWTWMASAPYVHLPVGNPPSVIAGTYCLMDYATFNIAEKLPPPGKRVWISRGTPLGCPPGLCRLVARLAQRRVLSIPLPFLPLALYRAIAHYGDGLQALGPLREPQSHSDGANRQAGDTANA